MKIQIWSRGTSGTVAVTVALYPGEWFKFTAQLNYPRGGGGGNRYQLYRRLDWPQSRFERMQKLLPPGFELRTIRPVESRYTAYVILAAKSEEILFSVTKRPEL